MNWSRARSNVATDVSTRPRVGSKSRPKETTANRFAGWSALALLWIGVAIVPVMRHTAAAADATKSFVPITPSRFMDTRDGLGGVKFVAGESRVVQIAGLGPVPAGAAIAVILNVTVTEPDAAGFLTVWPSDRDRPLASNLNYVAGQTVPNSVTVGLSADGSVKIFAQQSTHVIIDVVGWFYAGFNPVTPARLMDTREGLGGIALGPGEQRDLLIQGRGGLPDFVIGAVALNVTVPEPSSSGYVTVWPAGRDRPLASSLNFVPDQIIPNSVIVGVGSGGRISLFNNSGSTHLVVDVAGWFALGFDAVTPTRLMDTREGLGGVALGPGETRNLRVTGVGDVPSAGAGAVSLNVTVTEPTASGFLTVWPAGRSQPLASNLNFVPGQTVPNAVIAGVNANGEVSIFNSAGNSQVIVDITGWFAVSDSAAPQLAAFDFSPKVINTSSGAQTITVTARVTDDLSGVATSGNLGVAVRLQSPSGQIADGSAYNGPTSGNILDGVYVMSVTIPALAESGTWSVANLYLRDGVGNSQFLSTTQLATAGYPTTFVNN